MCQLEAGIRNVCVLLCDGDVIQREAAIWCCVSGGRKRRRPGPVYRVQENRVRPVQAIRSGSWCVCVCVCTVNPSDLSVWQDHTMRPGKCVAHLNKDSSLVLQPINKTLQKEPEIVWYDVIYSVNASIWFFTSFTHHIFQTGADRPTGKLALHHTWTKTLLQLNEKSKVTQNYEWDLLFYIFSANKRVKIILNPHLPFSPLSFCGIIWDG